MEVCGDQGWQVVVSETCSKGGERVLETRDCEREKTTWRNVEEACDVRDGCVCVCVCVLVCGCM